MRATDGAAPDLDALKARLEDLKGQVAEARADVDDTAADAKLAALDAQLEAIGKKTASPKIDLAGAVRAEAQLLAVGVQMDDLKAKADREDAESAGEGLIGRLLVGKQGTSGGFLGGLVGQLPLIGEQLGGIVEKLGSGGGGAEGAAGEGGGLADSLSSVAGSGAGLGVVAVAIGAVVTEATALASGLTAAGLGIGALGALAIPTFTQVFAAVGDTKAQLDKLPWPIRQAAEEIQNVKTQFDAMAKAFSPQIANLFSQAIGILSDNMKLLAPFAQAAIPAVSGVLAMLNKGLDSTAFKNFTGYMEKLTGPAITAIGSGMAGLAKDVMQLLTSMSQKDVINGINIAFRLLGAALEVLIGIVKISMATWDALTAAVRWVMRAFDDTRHAVATAGHDIAGAFDTVRHVAATAGHDIAGAFDTVRHVAATAGHDVAHAFDLVRHAVPAALNAVVSWVGSNWKKILLWLVDPIGMAVMEIKSHTHQISEAFDAMRHDVAAILAGARHDVSAAFDAVRHDTASILAGARHDIATDFDNIRHDVAATADAIPGDMVRAFDTVRHDIAVAWDNIRHDAAAAWDALTGAVKTGISDVLSFIGQLPGKILSFLAGLPGDMLTAGKNIIEGLIHGIESAAADIPGIMKGLASDVASYFTDPLKIFSPSRVFFDHGANIVQGAINGVQSTAPKLRNTMQQLGTQVARTGLGGTGGLAVAGAGGAQKIQLEMAGGSDDLLTRWFRQKVRTVGGGSVQKAFGNG